MSKMFEGRTIELIKSIGGTVAGQSKQYELWTQGGTITITNPEHVKAIDNTIKEAKRMNVNIEDYLCYMIDEEGILN